MIIASGDIIHGVKHNALDAEAELQRQYDQAEEFLALAEYSQVYLKITPINVSPKNWGKGSPETLFGQLIERFGADRIAWGSNFPNSLGTLKEILTAAQQAFSFAKASDQDWIFGKTAQVLYPALKD